MARIQAESVQICLFWHNTLNYNDVETTWPPEMRAMWNAFGNAIVQLRQKHGNTLPVEMYVCPVTVPENAVIVSQEGLSMSLLPAAQIYATYSDGAAGKFFLSKNLGERFSGINWKASDIKPYIEALLYRSESAEQSILCKLLPPLCNVGGWVWLGLAAAATLKASNSQGKIAKTAWTGGAALLWWEWYQRGGLSQLKETVGIGKYYDDVTIRPGSRVDDYWGILKPSPRKYGVEEYNAPYYLKVQDAIKHFKLYSIEFGNWLNQDERLNFMYATLVTLRDIAQVIGCKQDGMGFHKKLSLAFGSRGKGGFVAAFYQPYNVLINLTKTLGRGSFCHEYGHAVDHHLGWHSGAKSQRKQPDYNGKRKGSAAWLFETVIDGVLWNENGTPSSYHKWLDTSTDYFNLRAEIFARICETYFYTQFKEKGISNSWGVGGIREDMPSPKLVEKVAPQIKQIFKLATK